MDKQETYQYVLVGKSAVFGAVSFLFRLNSIINNTVCCIYPSLLSTSFRKLFFIWPFTWKKLICKFLSWFNAKPFVINTEVKNKYWNNFMEKKALSWAMLQCRNNEIFFRILSCLKTWYKCYMSKQQRPRSDCTDVQSDLGLCCLNMPSAPYCMKQFI